MPTRLIVMRHADSSWPPGIDLDHDRPLSAQGRLEAPVMSQALIQRDWIPDIALISSSERTQETFSLMMEVKSEIRPEIYLADLERLLPIATGIEEEKTTLILGHTPGCEMLVITLCGEYHSSPPATCALFTKSGPNWNLDSVLRFDEID